MFRQLLRPHSILITILIFAFIGVVDSLRLNMHYLDPFNNGIKDYETTDIVYAYLSERPKYFEDRVVLVNSGKPDRRKLARLIGRLDTAGAAVIGLDIFLEERKEEHTDSLLQQRIAQANVVLACRLQEEDGDYSAFDRMDGIHPFFAPYAGRGFCS